MKKNLANKLARTKINKLSGLDEKAFQKKLSGFLTRAGFPYHISKEVIGNLWNEIEKES